MKIIIVGCGKMGYTIAKVLSEKRDLHVTVVDKDPDIFENGPEQPDVIFLPGNGANERVLVEAGARDADLIVCTTEQDEVNVLCCIMAERLGTKHSVARVRNPEYMLEFNKLWKDLGIDMVINPERQTAREISRILRYPAAEEVDTFIDGRVELVSFRVADVPEYFAGKTVARVFEKNVGVLLAVAERDSKAFIPNGDYVFDESDTLRIMGRPSEIMKFLTQIKKRAKKEQEIIVIGGGRITHYLVELLNRHASKTRIKIIEKDRAKCEALYEALSAASLERNCLFIHGDGTNEDLLIAEEIDRTDAFVCLTDRDEENVFMSLYALRRGVAKVVTKVNRLHQNMARNLGLDVGSIVTPQNIAAGIVTRYVDGLSCALGSNFRTRQNIFRGGGETVDAVEFQLNRKCKCMDTPLRELRLKKGILIGCIHRGSEVIIPSGDTKMQAGDTVIILSKNNAVHEPDDILAGAFDRLTDRVRSDKEV